MNVEGANEGTSESRYATRMRLIREVGRLMAAALDPDELLRQIGATVVEVFGYCHAAVFAVDDASSEVVLRATTGGRGQEVGLRIKISGEGICAWVARTGRPTLAADVSLDPHFHPAAGFGGIHSELAVPIRAEERVIGVIDLQSEKLGAFENEDLLLLQALAEQAAIAIRNAGLYQQARQQTGDLALLLEASRLFSSTLDVEEVLDEVARRCVDTLNVDLALLRLVENDRLSMRKSFYRTPAEKDEIELLLAQNPITLGQGIAGRVALTGEVAVSGIALVETQTLPGFVDFLSRRRWIVVPMKVRDRVTGVLTFIAKAPPSTFDQREIAVAQGIANQAAVAIENAQLYEKAREANRQLQESEERFRTLFSGVPVGLYRSTPDGKILDANTALVRMLGYPDLETLIRQNAADLYVSTEDRRAWRESLDQRESPLGSTIQLRRHDGTTLWVQDTARAARAPDGTVLHYDGSMLDVTERKTLEEQLRQSQKFEALGRLAGGIAHDFNNILTSIRGYAGVMQMKLNASDPLLEKLKIIEREAERASTLTRQLLTFSRRRPLEANIINLNEVVDNIGRLLEKTIGERIRLKVVTQPGATLAVKADSSALQQIILNLCLNARDAMPGGGDLTVSTRAVTVDSGFAARSAWARLGKYVELSVSDTGIGMDRDTQEHIFEPFFTTKEGGTGLGLAMVYGLVQQHRGFMHVDSERGRGTVFKIFLPRLPDGIVPGDAQPEATAWPRGHETILIAEDEEPIRSLLTMVLRDCGYTVLAANDGEEAIRLFEQHGGRVDLAVLDLVMPGMGGRQVAARLRAHLPSMRLLITSGHALDPTVTKFLQEPGVEFLRKPFSAAEACKKVRSMLDPAV